MKNLNFDELKLVLYQCLWRRYQSYRQDGGRYRVHAWIRKDFIQEDIREIIDSFFQAIKFNLSRRQRRQLAWFLAQEMAVVKEKEKTVKNFCARIIYYQSRLAASTFRDRVLWVGEDFSRYFASTELQEKFFAVQLQLESLAFQYRYPLAAPYLRQIETSHFLKPSTKEFLLVCLLQKEHRTFLQLWLRFSQKRLIGNRIISSARQVFNKVRRKKNKPN